jgi:transcriptional regulator with XRE-family HTH domain
VYSTREIGNKVGIGSRLREERERLGLTQTEFAGQLGLSLNTQSNYERDRRQPDAAYLAQAVGLGVDAIYVLLGNRMDPSLAMGWPEGTHPFADMTAEEAYLLGNYRACTDANKQELLEASAVLANPPPSKARGG